MNLRRAVFIIAFALTFAAGPAAAQLQPAPPREPPCIKTFSALRNSVQAKGKALMAAQKRKVPLNIACRLLGEFTAAQEKMLKYVKANTTWCGIPPQIAHELTVGHANANKARIRICKLAASPPPPAGPTLSDALNTGIPDANNIRTGRGTFDTLTGTPLGK